MTHMKARALFKSANSFIVENVEFTFIYTIIFLVSEFFGYLAAIKARQAVGLFLEVNQQAAQNSSYAEIMQVGTLFKNIFPEESVQNLASSAYMPYAVCVVYLAIGFFTLALSFFAQALLRKRAASFTAEVSHTMHALLKAPWMIAMMIIGVVFATLTIFPLAWHLALVIGGILFILYGLFIALPLFYGQLMLYDDYYSFSSAWRTSWNYVKQSWFVLLKCLALITLIWGVVVASLLVLMFVFPGLDKTTLLLQLFKLGALFLRIYFGLSFLVMYNMIYNHVRMKE